jgi:hypothetical protein
MDELSGVNCLNVQIQESSVEIKHHEGIRPIQWLNSQAISFIV